MRSWIHVVKFDTRVWPSGVPTNPPQLADPKETIPINKFCSILTNGPPDSERHTLDKLIRIENCYSPESPAHAPFDHI